MTTRLRALLAPLFAAALLAAPRLAQACAVCGAGREDVANSAFLWVTIFLSVLPLSMFAGFGLFIWLRVRARKRQLAPVTAAARTPGALPTA